MNDCKGHLKAIADRRLSAADHFIDLVVETFGVSVDDAEKVFAAYRRTKVIKLDSWMGRYALAHGAFWAFWEPEVIRRAIEMENERDTKYAEKRRCKTT